MQMNAEEDPHVSQDQAPSILIVKD
eukprot:COSAG03_NODE_10677_length_636_cov_0.912477_2_plen_24_part_01